MSDPVGDSLLGLKDFQRLTVERVGSRMFDEGARRFLVADEVGLGKTMIARGIVARTVAELQRAKVKRIDIVYVCSNQEIARQNLEKLRLPGYDDVAMPSRLTLLPLHLSRFNPKGVNFVSFTPGTSFDSASREGWALERALLLRMLKKPWGLRRIRQGLREVFRVGARWSTVAYYLETMGEVDEGIEARFAATMATSPLREEADRLSRIAARRSLRRDESRARLALIGNLRKQLARICVDALEPDLVILDEFQRFSQLLDPSPDASEAARLAQQLFDYEQGDEHARVLLLSATPFKPYTQAGEDGTSHHAELIELLRFLDPSGEVVSGVESDLRGLRDELLTASPRMEILTTTRDRLEASLSQVMVRTERLGSSATRDGMLIERSSTSTRLEAPDVRAWCDLVSLHSVLRDREILGSPAAVAEYWKSSPWLAQFMEGYAFKRAIDAGVARAPGADEELADAINAVRVHLDWDAFSSYGPLTPDNPRARWLIAETVDQTWDLLWMPPSMPYYSLGSPYDRPGTAELTKRLVFSSWNVVPRAIAGILSYEAERRAQTAANPGAVNTPEARRAHERRLLDFKIERDGETSRAASMPTLAWLAPSPSLAQLGDPLSLARELPGRERPGLDEVLTITRGRIDERLRAMHVPYDSTRVGPDQRWYWAAGLLLDQDDQIAQEFWDSSGVVGDFVGDAVAGTENLSQHAAQASETIAEGIPLGDRPDDLLDVLAHLALAGPGNVALRALQRVVPGAEAVQQARAAARISWGIRQLFNNPESIAVVDSGGGAEAYWRQSLRYAAAGGIQSVVDEWAHVLAEQHGAGRDPAHTVLWKVCREMRDALGLSATRVEVDRLDGTDHVPWRTHFALRYGVARQDGSRDSLHPKQVRQAFNSPLRPFVLASTSVGQEGLDFHVFCHSVVHWNLPSNPVDLEQREGRVHRYKGHAVRRNVAHGFGEAAIDSGNTDPWTAAFDLAAAARPEDQDDLVPFWLHAGPASIERHIPALPFSRDAERADRVKRQVTLYRMVFGQARQDDLIAYLGEHLGQEEAERVADLIRLDLSPQPRETVNGQG
jgi:hypothetical protein